MKRVSLEDLMQVTGTGVRTTMRMVRAGKLPGFIEGRTYVCSPGEFQKWLDGDWQYTGVRSTEPHSTKRKPVQLIRSMKEEVA